VRRFTEKNVRGELYNVSFDIIIATLAAMPTMRSRFHVDRLFSITTINKNFICVSSFTIINGSTEKKQTYLTTKRRTAIVSVQTFSSALSKLRTGRVKIQSTLDMRRPSECQ